MKFTATFPTVLTQAVLNPSLTLSRLGGGGGGGGWGLANLPALTLNADISATVKAMILTFHDFS